MKARAKARVLTFFVSISRFKSCFCTKLSSSRLHTAFRQRDNMAEMMNLEKRMTR